MKYRSAKGGEEDLHCQVDIAIGLSKDLKDRLFVVEAHLLDLLELGRKLLSWGSGVCCLLWSTSEHILHHERVHATSKTT
jgi:hypothetical protein